MVGRLSWGRVGAAGFECYAGHTAHCNTGGPYPMRSKIASLLTLCVFVSVCAAPQSLGELARKERERREKNKDNGVTAREYSESEVFGEDEDDGDDNDAGIEGETESDAPGEPASTSPLPARIDIAVEPDDSKSIEEESRGRKQQEAEWRNRFRDARERVVLAREQKSVWDGVHHVEGVKLVDENGNVVVESLDDLRRLVAQANQELTDAERALKKIEEQARRAGVPPGWLR